MSLKDRLDSSVSQLETDSNLVHDWAHGNSQKVIDTEGGNVRSPAKLIADKDAEINTGAQSVLSQATAAATNASTSAVMSIS